VKLVVTQPDRPAGRGRRLTAPPVKQAAQEFDIPVYQPESLREPDDSGPLRDAAPDLLVVVAYGEILRRHILELAPHGALNVHPSLLPRYRGSSPIRAAILNGDDTTGISIIKLVRKLDAGPIVRQQPVIIENNEDAATLSDRLSMIVAEMLPSTCRDWIFGEIAAVDQDEQLATMTREWTRDDASIAWNSEAASIERLVRASLPWPVAWTTLNGEPFRILHASLADISDLSPGLVRRIGKQIVVGCGSGTLQLQTVQPAGKRAMAALGWWNGVQAEELVLGA
jgi:methionyl-tRNA formyltransferase